MPLYVLFLQHFKQVQMNAQDLEEGDFYWNEDGYRVFTEQFHLKRGHCCRNGCKHCPYNYDKKTDTFK